MTELELQQYLIREYPQENARCEWKEFKNLKNSFCGNEKDDVISYVSAIANMEGGFLVVGVHDKTLEIVGTDTYNYDRQKAILRLTERCSNLSSEGLDIQHARLSTATEVRHSRERQGIEHIDQQTMDNGSYSKGCIYLEKLGVKLTT